MAGGPADQAPLPVAETTSTLSSNTLRNIQSSSFGYSAADLLRASGFCTHEPDKTLAVGDVRCRKCGTLLGRGRL